MDNLVKAVGFVVLVLLSVLLAQMIVANYHILPTVFKYAHLFGNAIGGTNVIP